MTITIELPSDTLAALQAAAAQGRPVEALAAAPAAEHLDALYAPEDDLDTELDEAFVQLDAGQDRPFEEFAAEFSARFAARHGLPTP